jgi:rhodanese-related sulfurtransferase
LGYSLIKWLSLDIALMGSLQCQPKEPVSEMITPTQAHTILRRDSSILVIDVRTLEECKSEFGHPPNALLFPMQDLGSRIEELNPFRLRPIIAYCGTGIRSTRAESFLNANGFKAMSMGGGLLQWRHENLQIVKEKHEQ